MHKYILAAIMLVSVVLGVIVRTLSSQSITEQVMNEQPCTVRAIGTSGTDEGLDQMMENVPAGVEATRDGNYLVLVEVDCSANEMEHRYEEGEEENESS